MDMKASREIRDKRSNLLRDGLILLLLFGFRLLREGIKVRRALRDIQAERWHRKREDWKRRERILTRGVWRAA